MPGQLQLGGPMPHPSAPASTVVAPAPPMTNWFDAEPIGTALLPLPGSLEPTGPWNPAGPNSVAVEIGTAENPSGPRNVSSTLSPVPTLAKFTVPTERESAALGGPPPVMGGVTFDCPVVQPASTSKASTRFISKTSCRA